MSDEIKTDLFDLFLGPKGENSRYFEELVSRVIRSHADLRANYSKDDLSLLKGIPGSPKLEEELNKFLELQKNNLPYFHPRYSAQMLKDPTIPSILGYLAFIMSNPNNHAWEGGPVTTEMELEVVETLLKMCGFKSGWGHLASGGSLANMEAVWAARDYYGNGTVFFSEVSHYS
ncbi:MAG: hypothetical protein KA747_09365, partial [Ignavibacteriaceae bacterium]|nr:hypothetical protein [Ignavibacteriaceae bacterium]